MLVTSQRLSQIVTLVEPRSWAAVRFFPFCVSSFAKVYVPSLSTMGMRARR